MNQEQVTTQREKRWENRQRAEEDKTTAQLAADISQFINRSSGHNLEELASLLVTDHRFLQQGLFNLFIETLKLWAEDFEHSKVENMGHHYDDRNVHAVTCASEIIKHLQEKDLIYIRQFS